MNWRALICRIFGHVDLVTTPPEVTPLVECQRCGRTGWVLP